MMGNSESQKKTGAGNNAMNNMAVAVRPHTDVRQESLTSIADLDLGDLTRTELDVIENVIRLQIEFDRKEADRLRRKETILRHRIASVSQSFDSAPPSPVKQDNGGAGGFMVTAPTAVKCTSCGQDTECIRQDICFPEACKLTSWQVCSDCAVNHGLKLASGTWYHGESVDQSLAQGNALLKSIEKHKPTAPAGEPIESHAFQKQSSVASLSAATTLARRATSKKAGRGSHWTGRLQAYISYDKTSKSLRVALTKVLDLVDCEADSPIGVQIVLLPKRSSGDCQASMVSIMRQNGTVEYDQLLVWSQVKRNKLSDFSLEVSVWIAKPLELIGKADVPVGFLAKKKKDDDVPQFFSLVYNTDMLESEQVETKPSFVVTDEVDGDNHLDAHEEGYALDARRSTVDLADMAVMQQLGRIHSGGSPGTEIDNDDIDLEVVSSLEYMEKEAFLASGGDNGYIQSSSFQHRIQPLSMSMSTTDSALQMQLTSQPGSPHDLPQTSQSSDMLYGLEEELQEVSSQLDLLDEEDRQRALDREAQDKAPDNEIAAISLPGDDATRSVAKTPEIIPDAPDRGVIVVMDEMGSIHSRESFSVPMTRATLSKTSLSKWHDINEENSSGISITPEDSMTEADRVIHQTLWTGRKLAKIDSAGEVSLSPNPYEHITDVNDTLKSDKATTLARSASDDRLSMASGMNTPIATTDETTAFIGSVRLTLKEVSPFSLHVTIHRVKDISTFQAEKRSTSAGLYCKIYLNTSNKRVKAKTRVLPYSDSIDFSEKLTLTGKLHNATLEVMIWEAHGLVGRHVMICTCTIILSHLHLRQQSSVTHWYKLTQPTSLQRSASASRLPHAPSRTSLSSWVFQKTGTQ